MTISDKLKIQQNTPAIYQIVVSGIISLNMAERLGGMQLTSDSSSKDVLTTTLVGKLKDQAALNGILNTLYNMRFPVISVEALKSGNA